MMRHPLLLGVAVADGLALLLLLGAAAIAVRMLSGWDPGSAARRQIALETAAEGAALRVRFAFWFLAISTLLLVIAVAGALPPIVPGAMCGTGVLQAMEGRGGRALFFRLLGLAVLFIWRTADGIDRHHPESPLAVLQARILLLAIPAVLMGAFDTVRAVGALSSHGPVSCCAVIYDQVRAGVDSGRPAGGGDILWVGPYAALGLLLLGLAGRAAADQRHSRTMARLMAAAALLWVPVAAVALVRVLAAYHYGVLHHHCPWCLFLPVHGGVGYPLFGALMVAAFEGAAAWGAAAIAARYPVVEPSGAARIRRSGRWIAVAVLLFFLLSAGPAILWRLRFGVWMG